MILYPNVHSTDVPIIFPSNMDRSVDLKFNYSGHISDDPLVVNNLRMMLFRIVLSLDVKEVLVIGMNGYVDVMPITFTTTPIKQTSRCRI